MTSTIVSMSATAMCSSGVWISAIPFARMTHGSPRVLKTFASAPPPHSAVSARIRSARAPSARARRPARRPRSGSRGTLASPRSPPCTPRRSRRRRTRPASPERVGELALVVRARFGLELAPLGHDVAGAPAGDHADVRGGHLVDPSEPEIGDRACRGRDRGPPLLGTHPGSAPAGRGSGRPSSARDGAPITTSPIGAAWS